MHGCWMLMKARRPGDCNGTMCKPLGNSCLGLARKVEKGARELRKEGFELHCKGWGGRV